MLLSPYVLATGLPGEYHRMKDGLYRLSTSTPQEPVEFSVVNSFNAQGNSQVRMQMRSVVLDPISGRQHNCAVYLIAKWDGHFETSDVVNHRDALIEGVTDDPTFNAVLLGRR